MSAQLPWRSAVRIAWRELRAARAKFLFVVLVMHAQELAGSAGRRIVLRDGLVVAQ